MRSHGWDHWGEILWLRSLGWDLMLRSLGWDHMAGIACMVVITWLRSHVWDHLEAYEAFWKHSGGTQGHPGTPRKHSGGTQGHPETPRRHPGRRSEASGKHKVDGRITPFAIFWKVTVFLAESDEGDPHQVRSLSPKVSDQRGSGEPTDTPPSLQENPPEPLSVNTVRGTYLLH